MPKEQNQKILEDFRYIQKSFKQKMHEHFKNMELTAPQGMLMFTIHHKGSMKISEISKLMGLSNSTVSGIVDRLEAQGYVERIRSDKDRRIVNVHLTKQMNEKLLSHADMHDSLMNNALKGATKEEMIQIEQGLEILSNLLRKEKEETENA